MQGRRLHPTAEGRPLCLHAALETTTAKFVAQKTVWLQTNIPRQPLLPATRLK